MSKSPKVEVLPIEQGATYDQANVNKHTQKGGGLLENSLRKRGAFRSIASVGKGVDTPVVMAGNYTLEKAIDAGFTEIVNVHVTGNQIVNVVRDDLEPGSAEAIALGLEDNEIGKQSYNPDIDILAAVMADPAMQALKDEDKMLAGIVEGMGLKNAEPVDAEPQIDRAAELAEKWQTKSGQLWKLGNHRLLIGDCTVRENVERLMGGERADLNLQDPPYGIGKDYEGEDLMGDEFSGFHSKWLSLACEFSRNDKSLFYIFTGSKTVFMFSDVIRKFIKLPRLLIWYRPDGHGAGGSDYFYNFDPIFYGSISGKNGVFEFADFARDVWIANKAKPEAGGFEHSTVKALEVVEQPIKASSKTGDIVLDLFAGSGTTIIAAHNLNRRCYAMEISPNYGGVILERFYTATGITPELVE